MAKGFDAKQEEKLGYVLVLLPEADAYAALCRDATKARKTWLYIE